MMKVGAGAFGTMFCSWCISPAHPFSFNGGYIIVICRWMVWDGVLSGGGSIGGGLSLATSSSVKPSGARGPAGMMFLVKLV